MLEKYVKYEKRKIKSDGLKSKYKADYEFFLADTSIIFLGGAPVFEEVTDSVFLPYSSAITLPSSVFSFGVSDFVIEVKIRVNSEHVSSPAFPYLLSTSRIDAGNGFNCAIRGETTAFADKAILTFSTSTAFVVGQRVFLSSKSLLRKSGWNHVAIVRIGLSHYLFINGNLESTSEQTAKTNYTVETARLNSTSNAVGNGNSFKFKELRVYVGADKALGYKEEISNKTVVDLWQKNEKILNKRLYDSPKIMQERRIYFSNLLPAPIFAIDARELRNEYAEGQKVQFIFEKVSNGTRNPFQNDIQKSPVYTSGFLEFDENDYFVLPIPLNDSNFPVSNYRVCFYVLEQKVKNSFGWSIFSSSTNPNVFCGGTESDYDFVSGIGSKVYGIKNLKIAPERFLVAEIIRDNYYEIWFNGYKLSGFYQPELLRSSSVTQQYALENICGNGFAGKLGEILMYSFSSLNEKFIERVSSKLIKKWSI